MCSFRVFKFSSLFLWCMPQCRYLNDTRSYTWLPPSFLMNVGLIQKLRCHLYTCMLGLFLDLLSMGVSTNRYGQTSGRLLKELNVCTVLFIFSNVRNKFTTPALLGGAFWFYKPGVLSERTHRIKQLARVRWIPHHLFALAMCGVVECS